MFEARGLKTGTLYHTGETKSECHRLLIDKFPTREERTSETSDGSRTKEYNVKQLLPEPIMIKRKGAEFKVGGILY